MSPEKISDFRTIILKLLETQKAVRLQDIANAAGLSINSKNRRALQRALTRLTKEALIQPEGQARARHYTLKSQPEPIFSVSGEAEASFKNIPLSREALTVLHYVHRPIQARQHIGYNADFFNAYEPNQSFYLNSRIREELALLGRSENIIRPAGTYARNIFNRLLTDLSWNSSRLEGNTYSLLETKKLIEFGEFAAGKEAAEAQMILNHKAAIEYLIESADEKKISAHTIRSIHALLSENLLGDSSASGRLRKLSVGISGTTYLPLDNPHILKRQFDLLIDKLNLIKDPFEQSFFALVHLSYLQAFEDVNKRTARLAANIPLIQSNLKPLSFIDVSQQSYMLALLGVYEKNDVSILRDLYQWAYRRSAQKYTALQQTMGEPNLLKLRYRPLIQSIIRTIILEKLSGSNVTSKIEYLLNEDTLSENESAQLFQVIEEEIMSLHEGNIARFKVSPSEYREWKKAQSK